MVCLKGPRTTSLTLPLLGTFEFDLDEESAKAKTRGDKFRRYLTAHFSKAILGTLWMTMNVILFVEHFICTLLSSACPLPHSNLHLTSIQLYSVL